MANQYEDDEDDLDVVEQDQNAPANLRKALKASQKREKEMSEQLAQLLGQNRERSVKETLEQKGVSSKIAKFIPTDVNTSEQIEAWLADNADVFGFTPTEQQDAQPTETTENQRAYQRISASTQNASTPNRDADLAQKLAGAKTLEELNAITGNASARFRGNN
jgi:hypothetical protein